MKDLINIDDLYVVCKISEVINNLEPWIQYESFGKDNHEFYVNPKLYLVRPAKDKYDREGYEMLSTGEFIRVINPECSYESTSSCFTTLRSYCMLEISTGICINSCARDVAKAIYDDLNQYGYVMPFKEYIKNVLGIELEGPISVKKASILLTLINKRFGKFMLSYDKDNAHEQIDKKVRRYRH